MTGSLTPLTVNRRENMLAGAALIAAWATFYGWAWCVLLYPVLLAWASHGLPPQRRLLLAAGWGVSFAAGFYHWVGSYGVLPWLALSLVRGLPWLFFALPTLFLLRRYPPGEGEGGLSWQEIAGGAAGLGLVSWALLLGPTGVDWETPAGSLTAWPRLLFLLRWLPLPAVAALLALLALLLGSGRPRATAAGAGLVALWLLLASGLAPPAEPARLPVVALLQTGFSQDEKWDADRRAQGVERLLATTAEAAEQGAELVVWPETAWPYRGMRRRVTNTRKIGKTARSLGVDVLASSIEEVPQESDREPAQDGAEPEWLNSVSLVARSGKFLERYEKRRLAPFAEYLPLPEWLEARLRAVDPFSRVSRFSAGVEPKVFSTSGGHRFAVLICYESMTPSMAAELAAQVDFFVVVTNDAPFASGHANEAHFRSAILRALETGRPVLQAANTGVTGAVLAGGQVAARTAPGEYGASVQYYRPRFSGQTATPSSGSADKS